MKHIEVVAGIIIFNGLYLCMQRGHSKYKYLVEKYEFPGGKIIPGESRVQALARELKEEMNLDLTISEENYYMSIHHFYPDFEITMHSYLCRVASQKFSRNEHIGHQWLPASELDTLDWAMADLPIVHALIARDNHASE